MPLIPPLPTVPDKVLEIRMATQWISAGMDYDLNESEPRDERYNVGQDNDENVGLRVRFENFELSGNLQAPQEELNITG